MRSSPLCQTWFMLAKDSKLLCRGIRRVNKYRALSYRVRCTKYISTSIGNWKFSDDLIHMYWACLFWWRYMVEFFKCHNTSWYQDHSELHSWEFCFVIKDYEIMIILLPRFLPVTAFFTAFHTTLRKLTSHCRILVMIKLLKW